MKRVWMIIAGVATVGIILAVVGIVFGGNLNGSYFDIHGFHVYSGEYTLIEERNISAISDIDIDILEIDVEIVEADDYGYELYSRKESVFSTSYEDGRFVVEQSRAFRDFHLSLFQFDFLTRKEYLRIYLPLDAQLNTARIRNSSGRLKVSRLRCNNLYVHHGSGGVRINDVEAAAAVDIRNSSGSIHIDNLQCNNLRVQESSGSMNISNLKVDDFVNITGSSSSMRINYVECKDFYIRQSSGNVYIHNIEANNVTGINGSGDIELGNGKATNFSFTLSSGKLHASEMESGNLQVEIMSGNTRVSGIFTGDTIIQSRSGNVNIEVNGSEQQYNRNVRTSSGDLRINNVRTGMGSVNFNAENSMDVKTTSGNIHITFLS